MSVYVDPADHDHLYYRTHVQWQAPGIYSVYAHCIYSIIMQMDQGLAMYIAGHGSL